MIDVVLRLKDIGWTMYFHVAVTCYHTDRIIHELKLLGLPDKDIEDAEWLLGNCILNEGLTYVNKNLREAVVVVEKASSAKEFLFSLQHEIRHLVDKIARIDGFYYEDETLADLTGEINYALYPLVQHLMCEHCRSSLS